MPVRGGRIGRKMPIEVIDLVSSDEECTQSTKTGRKPLAPRTRVSQSYESRVRTKEPTKKEERDIKPNLIPNDIKPNLIPDEEDIKPIIPSQSSKRGSKSLEKPTETKDTGSKMDKGIEPEGVFGLAKVKKELEDIASEINTPLSDLIPNQSGIPSLDDLFNLDSPESKPRQLPPSPTSSSVSCTPDRYHLEIGSESEEEDTLKPVISSIRTTEAIVTPLKSLVKPYSGSTTRVAKLQALVQARQTPSQSRRSARYLTYRHSSLQESESEGDVKDGIQGVDKNGDEDVDENEAEDLDEEDYDLEKHYDTSLGSLQDFIVSDSYLSEDEEIETAAIFLDTDSENEQDGDEPTRSVKRSMDIADLESLDQSAGILTYSPVKRPITLPDFTLLSLNDSDDEDVPPAQPKERTRTKTKIPIPHVPKTRKIDSNWTKSRVQIAQRIFDELDDKVFGGQLKETSIEWNKRLTATAGMARAKREKQSDGSRKLVCSIELSDKVISNEDQIRDTLAHEMCHVACYIISDACKDGHGKIFKSWGRKVMRARPDIEVTTTHNYTIEYKYQWKCENDNCWVVYKRHSKSIDHHRERCYRCEGKLVPQFATKSANSFQVYLKANMKSAKASLPGASHGAVMRALSERWKASPQGDHQAHWAAIAGGV